MKNINKGTLYLIPTPIDENSPLEKTAFDMIIDACDNNPQNSVFVIEDLKPGRRRWLRFGLPRNQVESFVLYNEHTKKDVIPKLLKELKKNKNVYLMSDGGLPAMCDPGRELVDECHHQNIKVTATPFPNSIVLALALSGFTHDKFIFEGFIPAKAEQRKSELKRIVKNKETTILMDTPYRLESILKGISEFSDRQIFLGLDLNTEDELLLRGSAKMLLKKLGKKKAEFILILR